MKKYIKHAPQSLIFLNCFKIHDFDAMLRIKNFSLHLISHNDGRHRQQQQLGRDLFNGIIYFSFFSLLSSDSNDYKEQDTSLNNEIDFLSLTLSRTLTASIFILSVVPNTRCNFSLWYFFAQCKYLTNTFVSHGMVEK